MIVPLILTILFVFGIPLAAVLFAADAGMAICLLSFFIINPVVSVYIGVYAGFQLKKRWFLSLSPAVIFIVGAWSLFSAFDPIFLYYSAIYLVFSLLTMLITWLIVKRKN